MLILTISLHQFLQYNQQMIIILILIILIIYVQTINQKCGSSSLILNKLNENRTCPLNSHCLANDYCACDLGYIGGCIQPAYQMHDGSFVSATVTNNQYIFFSVQQNVDAYVVLIFSLCHSQSSQNIELIDVWEDKGDAGILNKENSLPGGRDWSINQGCLKLSTPLLVFSSQQNGESEKFILGIKLKNQDSIKLTLQLQVNLFDFWDLFQKFLLVLGSIFLLIFALTIAIFICKMRRGNRHNTRSSQNDISHFQNFMPKFKLNVQNRYRPYQQSCAVCLLELEDDEWLRKTTCNHVFHQQCIDEWCKSNLNCPICRRSFEMKDFQRSFSTEQPVTKQNDIRNPLID